MKKIIFALTILLCALPSLQAQEPADTTFTTTQRTIIMELPDGSIVMEITDSLGTVTRHTLQTIQDRSSKVRVRSGSGSDLALSLSIGKPHNPSRWNVRSGGFTFGFVSAHGHPSSMPVEMGKSFEIGWAEIVGVSYKATPSTRINLGFGLNWRNYKMTEPGRHFAFDADGTVTTVETTSKALRNSRLKVFNLQLPLTVRQRMPFRLFGQEQWVAAGITLNYSPHASMLTCYNDDNGRKAKWSNNKIGQRRWSYELAGYLGLTESVGLYLRYQPVSILRGKGQPDFRSLSTGLVLFY